jgi:hypothetical protein
MTQKTDAIIAHFTKDPALQAKIKKAIQQQKGNGTKAIVSSVVALFDLELEHHHNLVNAILKGIAGHSSQAIAGYAFADPVKAQNLSEKISYHKHTVAAIARS